MSMTNDVTFDSAMLKRFKAAYQIARKVGEHSFTFEGNEYLVSYAKYLIEYLELVFRTDAQGAQQ